MPRIRPFMPPCDSLDIIFSICWYCFRTLFTSAGLVPEPDLTHSPAQIRVDGHTVQLVMTLKRPRVVVFGGLAMAVTALVGRLFEIAV